MERELCFPFDFLDFSFFSPLSPFPISSFYFFFYIPLPFFSITSALFPLFFNNFYPFYIRLVPFSLSFYANLIQLFSYTLNFSPFFFFNCWLVSQGLSHWICTYCTPLFCFFSFFQSSLCSLMSHTVSLHSMFFLLGIAWYNK